MIRYITHEEIDKVKWDLCIELSVNNLVYGYSWYLDTVAPGWHALVWNDYEAVFPLTQGKKLFHYLYQPLFTQQLGLFYKTQEGAEQLEDFIKAIPQQFRFIDIQLNESNQLEGNKKWQVKKRKNFLLDLHAPYQKLFKSFNDPTRRNIKKSHKSGLTLKSIDSNLAVDFYIKHKGSATLGLSRKDYDRFKRLLNEADKKRALICMGVFDDTNELIVSGNFFFIKNRLYFINSCASAKGRKLRGAYFLVDTIINQYADQPILFDFEGSEIPGVAQFNKGFGSYKQSYPRLRINRLPWLIKWLKN